MSIWVLPRGSNEIGGAADGDLLVRDEGDDLHVARVVGDAVEWLGGSPVESIELPNVQGPTQLSGELAEQVQAFAAALAARGG